ncbi:MAG: serine/threonine protein kinase [Candidatus Krumholzibacteriota bacterium]|nr:serine/threonine protein kinase [Candidatus Krumholzibacteriota bacterium]
MQDKQFGDYKVLDFIGAGAMAKVYLAVHKDVPNLKVVLKVLSDSRLAERFKQEADKLALLDKNPNVCKIRHFFNHGDEFVIAMEYIEGPSLDQILKEKTSLPTGEALKIIIDIMSALEPAHVQGIYHRDIKPSNIMFAKNGQVKIIDFGIAKGKTDPNLTIIGTAAGTPEYMAPEQFEGGEDLDYSKCDIYAVGTMLYRMLTGDLPHKGDNEFVLRDSKLFTTPEAPSKLNSEINRELDNIIVKSIQCDIDKRYDSIAEMKAQLEMVYERYADSPSSQKAGKKGGKAGPSGTKKAPKRKARTGGTGGRSKLLPAMAGIVAVIAVAFLVLKFTPAGNITGIPFFASGQGAQDSVEVAADIDDDLDGAAGDGGSTGKDNPAGKSNSASDGSSGIKDDQKDESSGTGSDPSTTSPPPVSRPAADPATGFLKVLSRPGYADIYIDGIKQKEQTPFTFSLSPGRHIIKMVKVIDGVEQQHTETVIITRDQTKKINKRWSGQ